MIRPYHVTDFYRSNGILADIPTPLNPTVGDKTRPNDILIYMFYKQD